MGSPRLDRFANKQPQGKRTRNGGNRNQRRQAADANAADSDGDDDEGVSDGEDDAAVAKRSPFPAEDSYFAAVEKRHHKGKRTRNGGNRNQRRQAGKANNGDSDADGVTSGDDANGATSGDDDGGISSDDGLPKAAARKMRRDPGLALGNLQARHHKGKRTRNGNGRAGN